MNKTIKELIMIQVDTQHIQASPKLPHCSVGYENDPIFKNGSYRVRTNIKFFEIASTFPDDFRETAYKIASRTNDDNHTQVKLLFDHFRDALEIEPKNKILREVLLNLFKSLVDKHDNERFVHNCNYTIKELELLICLHDQNKTDLFIEAAKLKNRYERICACQLASNVDNENFKRKVLILIEERSKGDNNLLSDKTFRCSSYNNLGVKYKYFNYINKYNIDLFINASKLSDNIKTLAFNLIFWVNNKDLKHKVSSVLHSCNNDNNSFLTDFNNLIDKTNEFNISLLLEAYKFKDNVYRLNAYNLALEVEDDELRKKVLSLYKECLNNSCDLLGDSDFSEYIQYINKHNIELFIKANKSLDSKSKIDGYNIAMSVSGNRKFIKAKKIFDAFKKMKIPSECFNFELLNKYLIKRSENLFQESIENTNNTYNTPYKRNVLYHNEIDPQNYDTYKDLPECMLCYQGNDLYLRQDFDGKKEIIKLELSKDSFELLFPGNSLLTFSQGQTGDCYFLSTIFSLLNNPISLERFINLFSINNNDISITFPYNVPIIFKDGKPVLNGNNSLNGCLGWRLFEEAFSAYRNNLIIDMTHPVNAEKVIKHYDDLDGGQLTEVFHFLGFYNTQEILNNNMSTTNDCSSTDTLFDKLNEYISENRSYKPVITLSTKNTDKKKHKIEMENIGIIDSHAYTLLKINEIYLYLSDPHNTSGIIKLKKEDLNKYFDSIVCCIPSSSICYYSSTHTENEDDDELVRWWDDKINRIEDWEKRTKLLFENLVQINHVDPYTSFKNAELDPYILLNDMDMYKYFSQINDYNIFCFIEASKVEDKEMKLAAYKIASFISSEEEKDNFLFLLCNNDKRINELFKDAVFQKYLKYYLKNINDSNIELFLSATSISDNDAKYWAFKMASQISSKYNYSIGIKYIDSLRNNPNVEWDELREIVYLEVINEYNKDFYMGNDFLNNLTISRFICDIASKIKNRKDHDDVYRIAEFLEKRAINKDLSDFFIYSEKVNECNFELFCEAFKWTKKLSTIKNIISLASQIETKDVKTKFMKLLSSDNHKLFTDNIFMSYIDNSENCINRYSLPVFALISNIEDDRARQLAYENIGVITDIDDKRFITKVLNCVFNANATELLQDEFFYTYFYKVNKKNVKAFKSAFNIKDEEERKLKYYKASHIH